MKFVLSLLSVIAFAGCVKSKSEIQSVANPQQGSIFLESTNRTRIEMGWTLSKTTGINVAKLTHFTISAPSSLENIEQPLSIKQIQMLPKSIQIVSTCEGTYPVTKVLNGFKNTHDGVQVVFTEDAIFPVSDRGEKDYSQELSVQIGTSSFLQNPIEMNNSKNIFKLNLNKIRGLVFHHTIQCQNEDLILGIGAGYFAADISNAKAVEHLSGVTRKNKYPLVDGNIATSKFENLKILSTTFLSRTDENGFKASSATATPLDGGTRYAVEFKNIDANGKVLSQGRNWIFNECHTY